MRLVHHRLTARDIIGGNSALDLVNTVSGWGGNAEDWIPDAGSFIDWAAMSGLLSTREKEAAASRAESSPAAAERVLASLKELRFALWQLVDSLQNRKPANSDSLSVLNSWTCHLTLAQQIISQRNRLAFA